MHFTHTTSYIYEYYLSFIMANIPEDTVPLVAQALAENLGSVISPVLQWISVALGGLFGLYILYFIIKILIDRHHFKLLKEVKEDISILKEDIQEIKSLLKKPKANSKPSKTNKVSKSNNKKGV